jgi:hypothetical protein
MVTCQPNRWFPVRKREFRADLWGVQCRGVERGRLIDLRRGVEARVCWRTRTIRRDI